MSESLKKAGIYKLTCVVNGKIYIGKSVNIHKRLIAHKHCEKKSSGICHLQNAIIKYGWRSFSVELLEVIEDFDKLKDNTILLEREAYYIQLFDSVDKGYNLCKFSTDRTGIPCSEGHKNKIRLAKLGIPHTEETKQKMRKPKSEAHKEKCRVAMLGRTHSKESKEKMSRANLGKKKRPFSTEAKEKMRQARLGIKRGPHTEETKEKMRQSSIGKIISDEAKEKMRRAKLGIPRSDETKKKLRQYQENLRQTKLNPKYPLDFEN